MTDRRDASDKDNDSGIFVKVRNRSLIISILVVSVVVSSLVTASIFSSSPFAISSIHAQQVSEPICKDPVIQLCIHKRQKLDELFNELRNLRSQLDQKKSERESLVNQKTPIDQEVTRLQMKICNEGAACDVKCKGKPCIPDKLDIYKIKIEDCEPRKVICRLDSIIPTFKNELLNAQATCLRDSTSAACTEGTAKVVELTREYNGVKGELDANEARQDELQRPIDEYDKAIKNLSDELTKKRDKFDLDKADYELICGVYVLPAGAQASGLPQSNQLQGNSIQAPMTTAAEQQVCQCTDPNQEIVNGQCVDKCPSGATRDPNGQCQCTNPTQEIVNGQCVDKCQAGQSRDPNGQCQCTDPGKELWNGECLDKCGPGTVRHPTGGFCDCPPNTTEPSQVCNNQCISLLDSNNCLTCGKVCQSGDHCTSGGCNPCPAGSSPQSGCGFAFCVPDGHSCSEFITDSCVRDGIGCPPPIPPPGWFY